MTSARPTGYLILAVDDEAFALRSVTAALALGGFMVIVAENGAAGLEAFLRAREEIDLVLTDIVMPGLDGLEMVERIKRIRADVPIILMTAYSDAVISTLDEVKYPLIRKPFLAQDLIQMVRDNLPPAESRRGTK